MTQHDKSSGQTLRFATVALRLFIGGLFIYASIHKALDPASFAVSIRNYMILPAAWSNIVAISLPWVELGAGLFLILGIQTRPAALLTTGMLGVFLGAIVYAYFIGLDIDCGCFSSSESSVGRVGVYHIVRDTMLVLASLLVLVTDRGDFSLAGIRANRAAFGFGGHDESE
jgi:uncharacterized membrane protein YphA (DoxX/SURF4 family)